MKPDISVCITTYNLENYISECIESVFKQIHDYTFELIIVDDCSTDDTFSILKLFRERYPDVVKIYRNETNLKYAKNYLKALSICNGRYIAILDGDDYWSSTNKLKSQIDFLEQNIDYSMTHHNGVCVYENGDRKEFSTVKRLETYTLLELLDSSNIWNSSVVYRNIFNGNFPEWLSSENVPHYPIYPDYPLHILHAQHGKIKYFHSEFGVYRIHNTNISKSMTQIKLCENSVWLMEKLISEVSREYHPKLRLIKARNIDILAGIFRQKRLLNNFFKCVFASLTTSPFRSLQEYKDMYYHIFIKT